MLLSPQLQKLWSSSIANLLRKCIQATTDSLRTRPHSRHPWPLCLPSSAGRLSLIVRLSSNFRKVANQHLNLNATVCEAMHGKLILIASYLAAREFDTLPSRAQIIEKNFINLTPFFEFTNLFFNLICHCLRMDGWSHWIVIRFSVACFDCQWNVIGLSLYCLWIVI